MNIFDTQIGSSMNVTTTLAQFNKYIKTHAVPGPQGEQGPQGERGQQGLPGSNGVGISSITAGTPTTTESTTTTPIIFDLTDGNQQTLNVTAQNGGTASVTQLYRHYIRLLGTRGNTTASMDKIDIRINIYSKSATPIQSLSTLYSVLGTNYINCNGCWRFQQNDNFTIRTVVGIDLEDYYANISYIETSPVSDSSNLIRNTSFSRDYISYIEDRVTEI